MLNPLPFLGVALATLSQALVLLLYVIGTVWGTDFLPQGFLPPPHTHLQQRRWPSFCPQRTVGTVFRSMEHLREDFEAACFVYS